MAHRYDGLRLLWLCLLWRTGTTGCDCYGYASYGAPVRRAATAMAMHTMAHRYDGLRLLAEHEAAVEEGRLDIVHHHEGAKLLVVVLVVVRPHAHHARLLEARLLPPGKQ
eukprot:scaffold68440_cov31-Phaeocystis_antarctica.AAC.1